MSGINADTEKRILIVEDDPDFLKHIGKVFRKDYPSLDFMAVPDAGLALEALRESTLFDALILDLMMPYGTARQELESTPDPDEWMTGLRLLKWLRQRDQAPVWVAIVTALSPLAVQAYAKRDDAEDILLANTKVYYKPFDTLELERDLMKALGVPFDFPELLQADTEDQR